MDRTSPEYRASAAKWISDYWADVKEMAADPDKLAAAASYDPLDDRPEGGVTVNNIVRYKNTEKRRMELLDLVRQGDSVTVAIEKLGIGRSTYKGWRQRNRRWAMAIDAAKVVGMTGSTQWDGTSAMFAKHFFGMNYSWFQLEWLAEMDKLPLGSILLCLMPPEHGKTTMAENRFNEDLARKPDWRITVASESQGIARKILSRVRNRMEPNGPTPAYVSRWGPFVPQRGSGGRDVSQPWSQDMFNVFKKREHDERDYSMQALGVGSSIVSTRCDHLHCDDIQSVKSHTPGKTDRLEEWLRQDALSRPGEHGKTTICGTRVGEDDIYERLESDDELIESGILKVVKFPAIITDYDTGEQRPLFPERYTMEQLERQKRKAGQEAWDRNYMQNPGASKQGNGTFAREDIERCYDSNISLEHRPTSGSTVYVALDPALGSKNCVIAVEVTPDGKLIVRKIRERTGLQRNEEIMAELEAVISWCNHTAQVTDVVVESKNFQQGLSRDDRLIEMRNRYGFRISEHLTGINKYNEDIGVPSMATAFIRGEIVLPWAGDDLTREEIGELTKQLEKWRPGARGSRLRQDRVMALWFAWILWRNRWKGKADAQRRDSTNEFRRTGIPWGKTDQGLWLPTKAG